MQKDKALLSVTKALRNHNIIHRWGYPVKLTITREGMSTTISSLDEGLALLHIWDILPEQESSQQPPLSKVGTQDNWQLVSHKHHNKKQNS